MSIALSVPRSSRLTALDTHQRLSDEALSSRLGRNPRAHLPRRIVSDVLGVPAGQIRDPVLLIILMEADDLSRNASRFSHRASVRSIAGTAQSATRQRARHLTVVYDRNAIHEHVGDAA